MTQEQEQRGRCGQRLPSWLKRNVPRCGAGRRTARVLEQLELETVCRAARCPNRMECYSRNTAAFMILGSVCTRSCGFCAVSSGSPNPASDEEPERVAEAARRLGLLHVVITSVTRDDLPDGGAEHFCRCIRVVRERTGATVEVLIPDFAGDWAALARVVEAAPDVLNHNVETVPRLYGQARDRRSDYRRTLELLRRVKRLDGSIRTKSGLMLGLGETRGELLDVLADLLDAGCDFLTLGQYLRPAARCVAVAGYVAPEEFEDLGETARKMGFRQVAAGPLVRSSYRACEMLQA